MRATFTSLVFVAMGLAANAQFSLTPKAGLESSRTSINYNDLRCLSPLGAVASPQIGLRLDYKFKKSHGPYIGLATNRPVVQFEFSDPESGQTNYSAAKGNLQLRFEGGYRFSSKPIYFGAKPNNSSSAKQSQAPAQTKQGCNKYTRSSCGNKSYNKAEKMKAMPSINKAWNMRIQPSAGFAFNPSTQSAIVKGMNGSNYLYNAGNWTTAFTTGLDFEFARGRDRLFVLGFQYLKGLGNLGTETMTTQVGTKATTTTFSSRASAWNVTLGVPFTLSKNKVQARSKHRQMNDKKEKKQCIYYKPCKRA